MERQLSVTEVGSEPNQCIATDDVSCLEVTQQSGVVLSCQLLLKYQVVLYQNGVIAPVKCDENL